MDAPAQNRLGLRVRVTVRMVVDGVVIDEVPMESDEEGLELIEALGAEHGAQAATAIAAGIPYRIEIVFEDGQTIRFGSDRESMLFPIPVAFDELLDVADRMVEEWPPGGQGGARG